MRPKKICAEMSLGEFEAITNLMGISPNLKKPTKLVFVDGLSIKDAVNNKDVDYHSVYKAVNRIESYQKKIYKFYQPKEKDSQNY